MCWINPEMRWEKKYVYTKKTVHSRVGDAITHIDEKLFVAQLQYTATTGMQRDEIDKIDVAAGTSFGSEKTKTLKHAETSEIKYDLIGKVAHCFTITSQCFFVKLYHKSIGGVFITIT